MLPISPQRLALYVATALAVLVIGWKMQGGGASSTSPPLPPAAALGAAPAGAQESPVVVIDVVGAVRRPGVYRLPSGSRVLDAIKRARPLRGANLAALNMAARLADGEQIVVPKAGQPGAAPAVGAASGRPQIIHLNSATVEQLETLDGIGPSLAQAIIDYRTEHGGFRSLEELDQVSGIGPARLAALRDHVAL
ncbi:MAG: competence protein ComEA [Gaiellales bacterium]|nr:competence protein ComEA [Gaiellales bacterium]